MVYFISNYVHLVLCISLSGLVSKVCGNAFRDNQRWSFHRPAAALTQGTRPVVNSNGDHSDNTVLIPRISDGQMAIHFESEVVNIGTRTCTDHSCKEFVAKKTPRCANNEDFCEEDPEYDAIIEGMFTKILEESNILNDVFSDILIEAPSPFNNTSFIRSGTSPFQSESPTCLAHETIIYPKRGRTNRDDFVFILNQGEARQGIRVEKCIEEGAQCQFGGGGLPQTTCRQKYIYKKMLTIDHRGTRIVPESIYMPSCCICYVQNDFIQTRTSRNESNLH